MLALIIFLTCMVGTLGLTAVAARSDVRTMTMDNMYSVLVAGAFFLCYGLLFLMNKVDIFAPFWGHLTAGFLVFLVTLGLFSIGMLGGADSKLASALALWVGLKGLPVFLIFMTCIGGVLGVVALLLARWPVMENPHGGSWVAHAQAGESKVPYGIAIAGGALIAFMHLGYLVPAHWHVLGT